MKRTVHAAVLTVILAGALGMNRSAHAEETAADKSVRVYTTAKDTDLRLTPGDPLELRPAVQPLETDIAIFLNPQNVDQKVLGFGGAITDASAEVFAGLDAETQQEFLKAYFDRETGSVSYTHLTLPTIYSV